MSERSHIAERNAACPIDLEARWRLLRSDGTRDEGHGLPAGFRALWRFALRESIDERGHATGHTAVLQLAPELDLAARGEVTVALAPRDNSVLVRMRHWLDTARGVQVLEQLAQAHARLVLQGDRWTRASPQPEAESLAPITLASVIDDPDAMVRALKPGH